jgi:hypothetical protein
MPDAPGCPPDRRAPLSQSPRLPDADHPFGCGIASHDGNRVTDQNGGSAYCIGDEVPRVSTVDVPGAIAELVALV